MLAGSSPEFTCRHPLNRPSTGSQTRYSLFQSIPPERVGLNGEYDHNGLAKRVRVLFEQEFTPGDLQDIQVLQRGRVVILVGSVADRRLLNRLVQLALRVQGATDVEVYGVSIESDDLWEADCLNQQFFMI